MTTMTSSYRAGSHPQGLSSGLGRLPSHVVHADLEVSSFKTTRLHETKLFSEKEKGYFIH